MNQKINDLNQKISVLEENRRTLIAKRTEHEMRRRKLSETTQKLHNQRKQIQNIISNLLNTDKKQTQLDVYEWKKKSVSISHEIKEMESKLKNIEAKSQKIHQNISDLNQRKEKLQVIIDKWKGKLEHKITPSESLSELLKSYEKTLAENKGAQTKELEIELKEKIEANKMLEEKIAKQKKSNLQRIRKTQQFLAEIKNQNLIAYEKTNIEEQNLLNQTNEIQKKQQMSS